ncbi:MAG: hypothetical protein IJF54_05010, partial [Clostridia bacterium]|nr:hypothetical protein [Clostridia bacterium]
MKRIMAILIAVVMLLSVVTVSTAIAANENITLSLSFDKAEYEAGDKAELTMSISGIDNVDEAIGAFVIPLTFPTNTFKADVYTQADVDANPLLASSLGMVKTTGYAKGNSLANQKDLSISNPVDGEIRMVYVYADVVDAIQENGTICTLYLDVLQNAVGGKMDFDVEGMSIRNAMDTADLTAATNGVNYTVAGGATQAPTTDAPTTQAPTTAAPVDTLANVLVWKDGSCWSSDQNVWSFTSDGTLKIAGSTKEVNMFQVGAWQSSALTPANAVGATGLQFDFVCNAAQAATGV